jgi:hypothetical protein
MAQLSHLALCMYIGWRVFVHNAPVCKGVVLETRAGAGFLQTRLKLDSTRHAQREPQIETNTSHRRQSNDTMGHGYRYRCQMVRRVYCVGET